MPRRNLAELVTGFAVIAVAAGFLFYALSRSGVGAAGANGYTLHARFDNIAGLTVGAPVRLAGVRVGRVAAETIDPATYLADVAMTIDKTIRLPKDSSATVSSASLLGGEYLSIDPGASNTMLAPGQAITITQGAVSLESLLGKFIFSASNMASALGKSGSHSSGSAPAGPK